MYTLSFNQRNVVFCLLKNKYRISKKSVAITARHDHCRGSRHPRIGRVSLAAGTLARVVPMRIHCRQTNAVYYSDYTVSSLVGGSYLIHLKWQLNGSFRFDLSLLAQLQLDLSRLTCPNYAWWGYQGQRARVFVLWPASHIRTIRAGSSPRLILVRPVSSIAADVERASM